MAAKRDVAVIGIGKFGESIVNELIKLKRFVLAIDVSEDRLKKVSRFTNSVIADGSDIEALKHLGLDKFRTVIVASSVNIEIVATLIELGVKHIIAKAMSTAHERVLRQIGVDVIVKPEWEAGVRTALIATNTNFIKFSESLQEVGDGYAIGSVVVTEESWLNTPFKEIGFAKNGVSAISIKRKEKILLPNGESKLQNGDVLMLIGKLKSITDMFGSLSDETATKEIKLNKIDAAFKAAQLNRK